MIVDRLIAVFCFSFLFITTATAVDAKTGASPDGQVEYTELGHHGDKPWDVGDVSCGK